MKVRKFMRLLLVPGMAVPLVLVACSSDDSLFQISDGSHSLMKTKLVKAADSKADISEKIGMAAGSNSNANEPARLRIANGDFVFEVGAVTSGRADPREYKHGTATVDMTDTSKSTRIPGELGAEKEFTGYDITAQFADKIGESHPTLHAVVFTKSDDMNHLAFGLWMVEYNDADNKAQISVGAFGPRGFDRASFGDFEAIFNESSDNMMATFSGPSIGVATDGESRTTFDAMVSLTAERSMQGSNAMYSIDGTVSEFKGIEMENIVLGESSIKPTSAKSVGIISGKTNLESDPDNHLGHWEAAFASANSIAGSYGLSDGESHHLIGSFGAYKDDDM